MRRCILAVANIRAVFDRAVGAGLVPARSINESTGLKKYTGRDKPCPYKIFLHTCDRKPLWKDLYLKHIMSSPKQQTNLHLAIELAEDAGLTFLSIIEQHAARLSDYELYHTYLKADKLLASRQDDEDTARLRSCARIVMKRLLGKNLHDAGVYLPDVLVAYEARFIEQALEEERGSITRAAMRLGLTHQRLIYVLDSRHRQLREKRTPPVSRKTIIRKDK